MWRLLRKTADRLGQKRVRPLEERFFRRFCGRTLIVHQGLDLEWIEGLLKVGGGGGHFRIDARHLPSHRPTPVEWVVQQHVLPLALPTPLLVTVGDRSLAVRHLRRGHHVFDPAEIPGILEDMSKHNRVHARIVYRGDCLMSETMLAVTDNDYELPGETD
ncbi:MAG: hypothetical protein ACYCVY_07475 [Acidiferrobacteraceae bacterium]